MRSLSCWFGAVALVGLVGCAGDSADAGGAAGGGAQQFDDGVCVSGPAACSVSSFMPSGPYATTPLGDFTRYRANGASWDDDLRCVLGALAAGGPASFDFDATDGPGGESEVTVRVFALGNGAASVHTTLNQDEACIDDPTVTLELQPTSFFATCAAETDEARLKACIAGMFVGEVDAKVCDVSGC
jgi:hypothetical protein